ncbi:hypothetical protein SALBM311S_03202 [Streptomyces alboniger]
MSTGIDHLAVREPKLSSSPMHFGVEQPLEGFGLDGLFPTGASGFHDGTEVPLVRIMLRDGGAWCRLEAEDAFAVHVGWDQYLYIGSSQPCDSAGVSASMSSLSRWRVIPVSSGSCSERRVR